MRHGIDSRGNWTFAFNAKLAETKMDSGVGYTRKDLQGVQSGSITASLLIRGNERMKEKYSLLLLWDLDSCTVNLVYKAE